MSCFQDFREDKNLDQWHRKAAAAPSSGGSGGGGSSAPASSSGGATAVSLVALDYMLCQLVAMRGVVYQVSAVICHSFAVV